MDKIVEPFTIPFGKKITNSLKVEDNKQALKRQYEVLTRKASDIETELKTIEQSCKKRRKMEVGHWLGEVGKFKEECDQLDSGLREVGFWGNLPYGDHVKRLTERAEELLKQRDTFGELLLNVCETSKERLFTTRLHGEALKQELDNILANLQEESYRVPSIGIWGMGGVGKTTLARHIYTNLQGTPHGFYVYWVTVSEEADIHKLQHDLAKELKYDLLKDDDFETKAATLHSLLKEKKKLVIIFDDVWKWFDLRELGIPVDVDRCRVIITTRSLDVCNKMLCKRTIKLQPLPKEEAWELFLEKLDRVNKLSLEVEEVAKEMVKKCDGLPLAIITMARSMIGIDDIHEWRDALEELNQSIMGHNYMKDDVLPILLYSYKRLRDTRLQKCFLYCSMYPEDYAIPRVKLIELLISEGVMHQRRTRRAEFDQGHMILNNLVNLCLLDSVDHNGKEKWGVKMHDLLREMAIEVTRDKPKYMIKAGLYLDAVPDKEKWTLNLEKVSLMCNRIAEIPEGSSPRCPHLSTLFLSSNRLKLIPNSFFAHMSGLRVLNLGDDTKIEKLPDSISELDNLIALLLGGCVSLFYVPPLRKLKALIELNLNGTKIEKLPEGMEYLVRLKCLNMRGMNELVEIPSGLLSRFSHLQCLFLPNHIKVQVEEIKSLKMLEEFSGWVDDVRNFRWFNNSPPATSYHIITGNNVDEYSDTDCEFIIKLNGYPFKKRGVDVQLELPSNIQRLVIMKCEDMSGYMFDFFLSLSNCRALAQLELVDLTNLIGLMKWEPRALAIPPPHDTFSSLTSLEIERCHKIKKLFSRNFLLHNLRNLERLWIMDCDQMEEIIADDEHEDEGVDSSSSHSNTITDNNHGPTSIITLPKLRFIYFYGLPELESIYKGSVDCCDSIECIEIQKCGKLKRLPFFRPSGDENPPPPLTFPNLYALTLFDQPELKSICDGIMICESIKQITITGCRQLSRLPLFLPCIDGQPPPPSSLQMIYIREEEKAWWESLEWDYPNSNNVFRPFLRQ